MMKNDRNLKEQLNKSITLPSQVDDKMSDAYQQIRVESNSKLVAYRKPAFKRWMAVAATFTLMIATTVGVLAANGFFKKEAIRNEEETTYKFEIDYELKPGKFELTPGYLPDGYYEREMGKYWPANDEHSGISVFVESTADIEKQNEELQSYGEFLETTTIGNSEADILVADKANPDKGMKNIYIFNSTEGYVVWVWGDKGTPLAEVKKFAEELVVTRVADDVYETADEKTARQEREQEDEASMQEWEQQEKAIRDAGISDNDLVAIGTEAFYEEPDDAGNMVKTVGYTIESAEFIDSLEGYDTANFYNYDEVAPWVNADGSLKSYSRVKVLEDGPNASYSEPETINQSLLKVTVKAKRYHEIINPYAPEDALRTPLDGRLIHLEKRDDSSYTWGNQFEYMPAEGQDNYLQTDLVPIYMDSPQFTEGDERAHSFFYRDLAVDEEIEYTLLFVIDEDQKESLALEFNGFGTGGPERATWFKIK